MSSGVTLVAAGRDNPLNIDPDFTFFSTVYKRHTNFSSVIDRLNINTKPSNNGSSTSRFEIKGDLLSYVYLVCESPDEFTTSRDWSRVIDKVELFIGNQLVDTQYYEYSKKIVPDVQASSLSRSVKGSDGSTSSYFYPFKFFFCEDWASTIPLIALNYHDVEVVIHWADDVYRQLEVQAYLNLFANYWNTFSNVQENVVRIINATALVNAYSNLITGISNPKAVPTYDENTGFITFDGETDIIGSNVGSTALYTYAENYGRTILGYSFDLFTRYIYIDKDERRITADRSVDYVITQTQRIPASNKKEIELPLSHPVSFIASTASNFNDTNNMLLEINSEPIGESKPAIPHYRHVSTYFHSPYGSNQNTTMMYPFCLDASKKDPTGTLNFSRLDSARLILDQAINGDIYAVNYNILRISNGVGGLLYA